jgi:hypothetical protein
MPLRPLGMFVRVAEALIVVTPTEPVRGVLAALSGPVDVVGGVVVEVGGAVAASVVGVVVVGAGATVVAGAGMEVDVDTVFEWLGRAA